ncbi:hypothetical protein REPUB_Repub13aG0077600 [Reevesia pubescens]
MKEAFKARLLSRRWRYLSPEITDLCFDPLTMFGETIDYESISFCGHTYPKTLLDRRNEFLIKVAQCLRHLRVPKLISLQVSFCLWKENASYIDEWISLATAMGVEKLDLNFIYKPEGVELYSFPCHLLPPVHDQAASHLEHLCLGSCILRPGLDSTNRLSSLKTLFLASVPLTESDLECIASSCLKLERFILRECNLPKTFSICGQLHHLKSLVIEDRSSLRNIEIHDTINLNQFEYKGIWLSKYSFRGLPCLKRLHLWQRDLRTDFVFEALAKAVPHLENLSLCFFTTKDGPIPENITEFSCVKQMDLFVYVSSDFNLLSLTYILNAAPLLQKLHVSLCWGYPRGPRQPRTYNRHVHRQLKEVEISGFHNKENQVELAIYLLHNCIALQRMTININARIYNSNGRWGNISRGLTVINKKDIHDTLIKEIVDSNLGVELIVL